MTYKILLFGGRGSGKDTVTEMLIEKLPNATQVRLAGYVVQACKSFGIDNPTREDLVKIGTVIGRNQISKRVWIDMALADIEKECYNSYIISDVRFDNEYEIFVDEGFFPVLIDCELDTRIERVIKRDGHINMDLLSHESEQNYKKFKPMHVLDNNGTIEELSERVDTLISVINYWRCN